MRSVEKGANLLYFYLEKPNESTDTFIRINKSVARLWKKINIQKLIASLPLSGASLMAQMVKNLPSVQETVVQSLSWEDALEKGMATHCSILDWRIPSILFLLSFFACSSLYAQIRILHKTAATHHSSWIISQTKWWVKKSKKHYTLFYLNKV